MVGRSTARKRAILLPLIAGLLGLPACERAGSDGPPARAPEIALDTPEAATRSLLALLEAQCRAGARRDRDAVDRAREQIAWHIAARDAIINSKISEAQIRKLLHALAGNWAAMLLYYVDGIGRDALTRLPGQDPTTAAVVVPLTGPGDTARLVVTCVRGADNEWRVQSLRFASPTATTTPASAPAGAAPAPG